MALAAQLAALVEAYDRVMADERALGEAAESFGSLLEVGSLEEADKRIDELAASGKLDPALLLMMAKAYAGSKETDATKEEVRGTGGGAGSGWLLWWLVVFVVVCVYARQQPTTDELSNGQQVRLRTTSPTFTLLHAAGQRHHGASLFQSQGELCAAGAQGGALLVGGPQPVASGAKSMCQGGSQELPAVAVAFFSA